MLIRSLLTWIRANPNAKPPTMWRWSLIQKVRLSIHPCVYITEEASVSCMYNTNFTTWSQFFYLSVLFLMIELNHKMVIACCGSPSSALWQCYETKVTYKFLFPHWKTTVCVNLILLAKQKRIMTTLKNDPHIAWGRLQLKLELSDRHMQSWETIPQTPLKQEKNIWHKSEVGKC